MSQPLHGDGGETAWNTLRGRLARAARESEDGEARDAARDAALMAARARKLAEPLADAGAETPMLDIVILLLGKERIALQAHYVRAVGPFAEITPIPGTPDFVMGVGNFRGAIVPVFDIRPLFNGAAREHDPSARIVFLGRGETEFGIVADDVLETLRIAADTLGERPWRRSDSGPTRHDGVTRDALNVLDGEALLDDARFFIDETGNPPQA